MVCWVAERAQAAANVDRVIVATDSQQIIDTVESMDIEAILTAPDHTSGTDRVAEVAAQIPDAKIIVNVQGDEPLISPATIERAVDTMAAELSKSNGAGIVTTWEPIESIDDLLNPDLVKVVLDENDTAVYFSRSPIPYPRDAVYGATFEHDIPDIDNPAAGLKYRWCVEGDWKLLLPRSLETPPELYDLANDPTETENLAEQRPEIVARLREKLDQWWAANP